MIKILAIGNSFSDDSTAYLHQMAKCQGVDIKAVSLFIGACTLKKHWVNACKNKKAYEYHLNGGSTNRKVSIKEILLEEEWDVVTLQQFSGHSGILKTYYPFMTNLVAYVREIQVNCEIMIHQTWAYEIDSTHESFERYHFSQKEMFEALKKAYRQVARELDIKVIPFGEVIQAIRQNKNFNYQETGRSLCRDGHHMDMLYGRYALALTWYIYLVSKEVDKIQFQPNMGDGVMMTEDEMDIIKECVKSVLDSKV